MKSPLNNMDNYTKFIKYYYRFLKPSLTTITRAIPNAIATTESAISTKDADIKSPLNDVDHYTKLFAVIEAFSDYNCHSNYKSYYLLHKLQTLTS